MCIKFGKRGIVVRYNLLFLFGSVFLGVAYAQEFPSDEMLNGVESSAFPDNLSINKAYLESSKQWENFKALGKSLPNNFPKFEVGKSQYKSFDEILRQTKVSKKSSLDPNLLVFASFSMPEARLKALITDTAKVGGVVLLRGLLVDEKGEPSFKRTAIEFKRLALKKGEGLQIAPNLYEKYWINKVPAFLVFDGGACLKCSTEKAEKHGKVYGDVSLGYALEEIGRLDTDLETRTKGLLYKLNPEYYGDDK